MRANTGSNGQQLCRSKTGAFCQKKRDNREKVSPVPPLPLSQSVRKTTVK